jgi:hypothetical protein
MQPIPNALAAFDLRVVSIQENQNPCAEAKRALCIGWDFMVRGHGERCKAPELLFSQSSHYQAVLGARSSSPSHLFARDVV